MKNDLVGPRWAVVLDMEDRTTLRQMDAHVQSAEAWILSPGSCDRTRAASDQGTPVPMDEHLAAEYRRMIWAR